MTFTFMVVLLVTLVAGIILSPALGQFDARASEWVRSLRTPELVTVAKWVTHLADTSTMLVLVPLTAVLLWALGRRSGARVVALTVLVGWLLGNVMQRLVHRARPIDVNLIPLPTTYSFPSGHTLAATLYFGTLAFIALGEVRNPVPRYALVGLFWALTAAVGLSRVYLGVHFLGDVVAGWLLGDAVVIVAILGYFALSQPDAH